MAFLSLERKASQMVNHDSDLVQLPWRSIEDIDRGLEGVDRVEAVQRLLLCPAVSTSKSRYISDVFSVLFHLDFRGCFYNGLPPG